MGLVALLVVASLWVTRADQGGETRTPANPSYFTGNAYTLDTAGARLTRMGFDAGARANWHVHDGGQLAFVEQGALRMQIEGQEMRELRPGESAYLPSNVPHWHGAAPDQACIQVGVTFAPGTTRVMEKVTDAQYGGKAGRQ